jgi:membrane-bound ClpP family serine protease
MTQRDASRSAGTTAPPPAREDAARRFAREPLDDPVATRDPHWRDEVIGVAGLNVIAGIWLILSPWILGYTGADATWNPIVFGAIVLVLALARIAKPAGTQALSAINAIIGVWLFIAGFWLADSAQASWNCWVLGVIVFVMAAIGLTSRENAVRA